MSEPHADFSQSQNKLPLPEVLAKVENSVQIALRLVPDTLRACIHFIFRPAMFLRCSLGIGNQSYEIPPYIFLIITSMTMAIGLELAAVVYGIVWEAIGNALAAGLGGNFHHESSIRLARMIQQIQERSLTGILFTTAAIVMIIAALARRVARVSRTASAPAASPLERALCYVSGGGQVQTFLMLPVIFFLVIIEDRPFVGILLALVCGYCVLWPAVIVARTFKLSASSRSLLFRLAAGVIFAALNLTIVAVTVWAADAIPNTLEQWRTSLLPVEPEYQYRVPYKRAIVTENSEFVLTVAIHITEGRPLVADMERMTLSPLGHVLSSEQWTETARLIDSSKGQVPILIVGKGETAWIKIAAQMPDGVRKEAEDGLWSSKLFLGHDFVDLDDVPIEDARLRGRSKAPSP